MDDDLDDAVPAALTNPLLRDLDSIEQDLLAAIWDPIEREVAPWPVWDYVSRTLYRTPLATADAGAVLASLPTTSVPILGSVFGVTYGLVWRSGQGLGPAREERVGLTIAGLVRLSEQRPELKELADRLVGVIGVIARAERDTPPNPHEVVNVLVQLDPLVQHLTARVGTRSIPIPNDVAIDILSHECAPLGVQTSTTPSGARPSEYIRPYRDLAGADDYLSLIGLVSQEARPAPTRRSEELARTLDYVSHVLKEHPAWPENALLGVHDLETAATLSSHVDNKTEFVHRLSALAIILTGLQVPAASAAALRRIGADRQPGTLVRLREWMVENLEDESSAQRAVEAIRDLQSANDLRVLAQHEGSKPHRNGREACRHLGIEYPIRAWGPTWETVQGRVADAFDVIRQEVTALPSGPGRRSQA